MSSNTTEHQANAAKLIMNVCADMLKAHADKTKPLTPTELASVIQSLEKGQKMARIADKL